DDASRLTHLGMGCADAGVSFALTQRRMNQQVRRPLMLKVALIAIRSWPSDLSRTRPFELTASAKCFRPMKTIGAPARANIPPKYPPTAPAPTTAIRGHSRVSLINCLYAARPASGHKSNRPSASQPWLSSHLRH